MPWDCGNCRIRVVSRYVDRDVEDKPDQCYEGYRGWDGEPYTTFLCCNCSGWSVFDQGLGFSVCNQCLIRREEKSLST